MREANSQAGNKGPVKVIKLNPSRRVRSNSTTLHNLSSVKITRNRDGTVGILARRNAPNRSSKLNPRGGRFGIGYTVEVNDEFHRQPEANESTARDFTSRKKAEAFARRMRARGYRVTVKDAWRNPTRRYGRPKR
jgi:hypothetical protein